MNILAVNAGSSSFKFKLFNTANETVLAQGAVERIGGHSSAFQYRSGKIRAEGALKAPDHLPAVQHAIAFLKKARSLRLDGVGFKTVFAKDFTRSTLIDERVVAGLEAYIPVMPLHNPAYLACIRTFQSLTPDVPLAAVFETAFHETVPPHARELGLPRAWVKKAWLAPIRVPWRLAPMGVGTRAADDKGAWAENWAGAAPPHLLSSRRKLVSMRRLGR